MTISIDNRSDWELNHQYERLIEKTILESLHYEEFDEDCEISVSIVNNEEIKQINKQFRKIDKPTDVLSFPQLLFEEGGVVESQIVDVNEKDEVVLGDIVISIDKAIEQAQEYGHGLEREIAFLTAHSMLHLLGYDHIEAQEEKEMFAHQKEILKKIGISRKLE